MSRQWTLANVFAFRALGRGAGRAPIVAGLLRSRMHARGKSPVSGCARTEGETARSVSREGLRRGGDDVAVRGEGPSTHREMRRGDDARRGHDHVPVTQQLERRPPVRLAARAARRVVPLHRAERGDERGRARVATVEGAAVAGSELAELALQEAVADAENLISCRA